MADRFVIKGVKPYDGEYPLDDSEFTTREWSWIKKISGYLPMTAEEGFKGGDPELFVALAVIAMVRAERIEKSGAMAMADRLMDESFGGAVTFIADEADEDEEGEDGDPQDAPSEPA